MKHHQKQQKSPQRKKPPVLRQVRKTDQTHQGWRKVAMLALRYLFYGMVGVFAEVSLYTLAKVCREVPVLSWIFRFDWKVDDRLALNHIWEIPVHTLFGQCSLWMFGVYALCSVLAIEPLYRHLFSKPFWVRGICYAFAILAFEFTSGWVLEWVTGYKIWYYADILNIMHQTSLYTLPMWFVTGFIVEFIYREMMDTRLREALDQKLKQIYTMEKDAFGG